MKVPHTHWVVNIYIYILAPFVFTVVQCTNIHLNRLTWMYRTGLTHHIHLKHGKPEVVRESRGFWKVHTLWVCFVCCAIGASMHIPLQSSDRHADENVHWTLGNVDLIKKRIDEVGHEALWRKVCIPTCNFSYPSVASAFSAWQEIGPCGTILCQWSWILFRNWESNRHQRYLVYSIYYIKIQNVTVNFGFITQS